jgi:hypothetical protein
MVLSKEIEITIQDIADHLMGDLQDTAMMLRFIAGDYGIVSSKYLAETLGQIIREWPESRAPVERLAQTLLSALDRA